MRNTKYQEEPQLINTCNIVTGQSKETFSRDGGVCGAPVADRKDSMLLTLDALPRCSTIEEDLGKLPDTVVHPATDVPLRYSAFDGGKGGGSFGPRSARLSSQGIKIESRACRGR